MRASTRRIATTLALVGALAGCGRKVDRGQAEAELTRRLADMKVAATRVTCPGDVEARTGQMFSCKVEIEGKQAYALDVTIAVDPESKQVSLANNAWHDGPAVQAKVWAALLGDEIGKDVGGQVTVACGDEPLRFLDADDKLRCQLVAGDVTSTVTVEFDKALRPKHWQLAPRVVARAKLDEVALGAVRDRFPGAQIACGTGEFVRRPDDGSVDCTVTVGGERGTIKLEFDALTASRAAAP
jgi:hypothetical protein